MTDKEFRNRVLQWQPYMQKLAEQLLGDADNASDAVQDAVVSLWEKRKEWDDSADLKPLWGTIVKRRCIDQLRKQRLTVPIDTESLMLTEPSPDDLLEERYQLARQLVDRLPKRQRDAILMKYEEGMNNEEIEKATGMSSTHLYATLSRAYKSLRNAIEQHKNEQK
ncbi:MAG: sigma-70 family RNA polymerase sigma factor [Bacteroidales bacterium]|nr:sigma-70 family RNA polymerase sigma factor [Bacteroidales bacterium]